MNKTVDMASNGRLVVPTETRKSLGIGGHEARFQVEIRNGSIVLTPVMTVPVDSGFPITPELVESAARAAAEPGRRSSRAAIRAAVGR